MGDTALGHPYDGDGILASCSISEGRAFFRSRFIETEEYQLERATQKVRSDCFHIRRHTSMS